MNREQLGTRITFRLTEDQEKSMLEAMKRKHVTKASDFIRQAVLAEIERTLEQNDLQTSIQEILSKVQNKDKEAKTMALMQEISQRLDELGRNQMPYPMAAESAAPYGEPSQDQKSTARALQDGLARSPKKTSPSASQKR